MDHLYGKKIESKKVDIWITAIFLSTIFLEKKNQTIRNQIQYLFQAFIGTKKRL